MSHYKLKSTVLVDFKGNITNFIVTCVFLMNILLRGTFFCSWFLFFFSPCKGYTHCTKKLTHIQWESLN